MSSWVCAPMVMGQGKHLRAVSDSGQSSPFFSHIYAASLDCCARNFKIPSPSSSGVSVLLHDLMVYLLHQRLGGWESLHLRSPFYSKTKIRCVFLTTQVINVHLPEAKLVREEDKEIFQTPPPVLIILLCTWTNIHRDF